MLTSLLSGSASPKEIILELLISLPIIFLVISAHEAAHGYVANKLGDPTAKNLGRLTLNPLKHLDPFGFICMLLVGIGWAKPVPINSRYFKNPRRDMALTGAAGPVTNLLLAFVFAALYKLSISFIPTSLILRSETSFLAFQYLLRLLGLGMVYNVAFAVFNMLPIPPFDGSRVLYAFLPPKYYFGIMKYERYISIVLMLLLVFGVLSPVFDFFTYKIIGLISLLFGI